MTDLNLAQSIMRDPSLRESLRNAETPEQRFLTLNEAGFSDSDIHNTAEQTSKFFDQMLKGKLQGKLGSFR